MRIVILLAICTLAGCSTIDDVPSQRLIVDKDVHGMSRNEVIYAIQECEGNRTRAVMIMAKRKIGGRITDVVADVTCAPKYNY
jgi:hypothetical protein